MIKKILLASAITAFTTNVALANTAPYIGGSVGLTNNTAKFKFLKEHHTIGAYRGVPFNFFAGYGGTFNDNFYLAGEVFATAGTVSINEDPNTLRTSYGYGVSLIPGVCLGDRTIAFTRIGVIRSKFPEKSETLTGGQFGVGMQTSLTQNVDIRGEYDFVVDRSFKDRDRTHSTSPRADQFAVGVMYKFD